MSLARARLAQLGLLVVLSGCSIAPNEGRKPEKSPALAPPVSSNAASARTPAAAADEWKEGDRYSYRLKLTSSLAFAQGANAFDFDITSNIVIAPARVATDQTSLFVVFVDPKLDSRAPDPQGRLAAATQQLSQFGCFFTMKDGRVADMHLAPGLPAMVVSIYRQLGAALQVVADPDGRTQYEVREYDGTGEYAAQYTLTGDQRYEKRKLKYLSVLAKASDLAQPALAGVIPEVVSSTAALRLAPDGRPLSIHLRDELRVNGAQLPVHSTTVLTIDADSVAHGAPVNDWPTLGDKLVRLAADEPFGAKASVESLDDARINGQSFDQLVAKLTEQQKSETLPDSGANPQTIQSAKDREQRRATEESAAFVALTATFRKDSSAAARAVQRARSNPAIANTLIDSMGSSGSPSAHVALAGLLTAKGIDPKLRLRALTGLARTPVPSEAAVEALKGELSRNPFSTGALYGLGSYAMYFRDNGDRQREASIGALLLERLDHADDVVPRLIVTLGGITNSGYLGALPAVTRHMQDRRPGVRAAAVRALQFMPGPQIDPLIASALLSDTDLSVTVAALDAVQAREPSDVLAEALTQVARRSDNPNARYKSVDLLARWGKGRPALRTVIQQVASSDPEERVRALAQSAL